MSFFKKYSNDIFQLLNEVEINNIDKTIKLIRSKQKNNKSIYLVGNGGSSSIASHVSVDLTKIGIISKTFNNSNIITRYANDYGHENWIKEAIKSYCDKKDLIILISSSGNSANMITAAKYCKKNNYDLITLTGFNNNNKLSKLGKINYFVNSKKYNYVEMVHHIILVSIVDLISKKYKKYS